MKTKLLIGAIIAASLATIALLYAGAFTCRPGDTGLKIGGAVTSRGC